jgi:hypothetical protein
MVSILLVSRGKCVGQMSKSSNTSEGIKEVIVRNAILSIAMAPYHFALARKSINRLIAFFERSIP